MSTSLVKEGIAESDPLHTLALKLKAPIAASRACLQPYQPACRGPTEDHLFQVSALLVHKQALLRVNLCTRWR